ncbi:hypothetical protein G6F33_007898 [Rhizopus arrhizus]|nr:hypothetical protein G6F33_007898 [Rhizopus arrhizus]
MTDLFKSKENEFYIELKQERYYFPGDDISGIYYLKKSTKTNNIKLSLEGVAEIGGKSTTIYSKSIYVSQPPQGEKSYLLDACTHRFPFTMRIPKASDYELPSTLMIPKLLKISYRLVAVRNRPYAIMEKFCSTTTETVTIWEDINVESDELNREHHQIKEFALTKETDKVKVTITLKKRGAVKGDTIPIYVTIHHIGAITKEKGIKVQLVRYVYYGKNKNELFGPKSLSETSSDIEISGPVDFTDTFNLNLPIPTTSCPTVDTSCPSFRIEYNIKATVNLNDKNIFKKDKQSGTVIFNIPFIIGTRPKLDFSIEDDNDGELEEIEEENLEYEQVFEKMKELDINSVPTAPITPISPLKKLEKTFQKPNEFIPDEKDYRTIKPLPRLQEQPPLTRATTLSSTSTIPLIHSPLEETFSPTLENVPVANSKMTIISPSLEYLHEMQSSSSNLGQIKQETIMSNNQCQQVSSIHRRESMRWVVRADNLSTDYDYSNKANYTTTKTISPPPLPPRPAKPKKSISDKFSPPPVPSRPIRFASMSTPLTPTSPGVENVKLDTTPPLHHHHFSHQPSQSMSSIPVHKPLPQLSESMTSVQNMPYSPQYHHQFMSMPSLYPPQSGYHDHNYYLQPTYQDIQNYHPVYTNNNSNSHSFPNGSYGNNYPASVNQSHQPHQPHQPYQPYYSF